MIFLYYLYLITSLVWGAPQSPAKTGYTPPQGYVLQASSSDTLSDPSTGNDSTARDGVFEWHFWAQCSDKKKNIVKQAWEDSKEFSDAWASWVPKGDFQQVVDMYMGLDSIKDKMRTRITDTISRHQGLYKGRSTYGNAYLWVYCNDDSFWFNYCKRGVQVVIAFEQEDIWYNNWYITFCPPFFDSEFELPLSELARRIKTGERDRRIMESYTSYPGSQAAIFFHEAFHMSKLVTSPRALDPAYGPADVYDLARKGNTEKATVNADSWCITGQAIWAQLNLGLANPPVPLRLHKYNSPNDSQSLYNSTFVPDVIYVDSGNVVPQGAMRGDKGWDSIDTDLWDTYIPAIMVSDTSAATTGGAPVTTPSKRASSSSNMSCQEDCGIWSLGGRTD